MFLGSIFFLQSRTKTEKNYWSKSQYKEKNVITNGRRGCLCGVGQPGKRAGSPHINSPLKEQHIQSWGAHIGHKRTIVCSQSIHHYSITSWGRVLNQFVIALDSESVFFFALFVCLFVCFYLARKGIGIDLFWNLGIGISPFFRWD